MGAIDPTQCGHQEPDGDEGVSLKVIINMAGDEPHGGKPGMPPRGHEMMPCDGSPSGRNMSQHDLEQQLLEAISLIDTMTDGALNGTQDAMAAIQAIDGITSRILWGKQEESNPLSSYQNANYSEHVAAGLMMSNPADDRSNNGFQRGTQECDKGFAKGQEEEAEQGQFGVQGQGRTSHASYPEQQGTASSSQSRPSLSELMKHRRH